jgi:hypothetical protein
VTAGAAFSSLISQFFSTLNNCFQYMYVAASSSVLEAGQLTFFIYDVEIFADEIFFQYFPPLISLTVMPCHRSGIAVDRHDKPVTFSKL